MKYYGQNNEDGVAFSYLVGIGIVDPVVLDIGANDGVLYSNSRLFSDRGNTVHLVEPSETALLKLRNNYADHDATKYSIWPFAIVPQDFPEQPFYESGTLVNRDDVALVSTFSAAEKSRWPGMNYKEIEVAMITFEQLYGLMNKPRLDLISIDCEGLDFEILCQIDFSKIFARVVIVENNGKEENKYINHMKPFNFRLFHKNGENLIFCR